MMDHEDETARLARLFRSARLDVPGEGEQHALLDALAAKIAAGAGEGGDGGESVARPARVASYHRTFIGGALLVVAAIIAVRLDAAPPRANPSQHTQTAPTRPSASPQTALERSEDGPPKQADGDATSPPAFREDAAAKRRRAQRTLVPSEAALIEEARRVVRSNPARALELTQQHKRAYRSGELAPEREVVAIEALARLGRRNEALARANAYRKSHPVSIHNSRIEAALADPTKSASH